MQLVQYSLSLSLSASASQSLLCGDWFSSLDVRNVVDSTNFQTGAMGQVQLFSNERSWPANLVLLLAQVNANELQLKDESCQTIIAAVVGRQSDLNLPIVLRRLIGSFSLQLAVREGY